MPLASTLARRAARSGVHTGHTSSLAPGHIQANLLVLPSAHASDFQHLCFRNPVSCPLLATSTAPGNPHTFDNATLLTDPEFDIRTDIPSYNVYRSGQLVCTKADISQEWDLEDSVAFLLGCSFSFEAALAAAGLPPRHWETGGNVPMYRTTVKLNPAGVFTGACQVVSMRPYPAGDVERVREICRPYLRTHGEPVAWGWGLWGSWGLRICRGSILGGGGGEGGEVPIFWGCGVTPQVAVMAAGEGVEGWVMAHEPGCMLVLDVTEGEMFGVEGGDVA